MDRGTWRATVHGVTKNRTQLIVTPLSLSLWVGKGQLEGFPDRGIKYEKSN